jgi:isopenicillin N synthase-like dioxygenase
MDPIIPVVNFSPLSIEQLDEDLDKDKVRGVASELFHAFSTVGFVYLRNTGVSFGLLDELHFAAEKFFNLPFELKHQFKVEHYHGWIEMEQESVDTESPGDLKEAINFTKRGITAEMFPTDVPEFSSLVKELFSVCTRLAHRVLLAIAIGLNLPDSRHLIDNHNVETQESSTTLRVLSYPPLPKEIKPGQVRLGEHTDYGSVTLLFQDQIGGLQVATRNGDWIDATPIEDTVVVNIADLMQRWTADKLVSTPHRVLLPVDENKKKTKRRSVVFFAFPDPDTLVTCLDGSNKYEPIIAEDYLQMKMNAIYNYL